MAVEDPYRDKAAEREIEGPYKDGAREVRRLLGWEKNSPLPFLSTRNASHKTGISNGTINTMASGGRSSVNTIELFAAKMNGDVVKLRRLFGYVSPEEISASAGDPLSRIGKTVDVSAISRTPLSPLRASAGEASYPGQSAVETDTLGSEMPGDTRAIRVDGDCMEPLYHGGDILLVRETKSAENGDEVIALLDDDSLACKVYRANGEAYLQPTNGEGRIPASRFRIVGVVEGLLRIKR